MERASDSLKVRIISFNTTTSVKGLPPMKSAYRKYSSVNFFRALKLFCGLKEARVSGFMNSSNRLLRALFSFSVACKATATCVVHKT